MSRRSIARSGIKPVCLLGLICVFCLIQSPQMARANPGVIRVAPNGATSGACGDLTDWSNPCELQYALTTVAVPGDELWVAAGTYTPTTSADRAATFQLRSGIAVYGGFAATENARDERDFAANPTILSGDIDHNDTANPATSTSHIIGDNSYHVVMGSGTDSTAVLDGFTVTAGYANGSPHPFWDGGGMFNDDGRPSLTNVTFSGNLAGNHGSGMYNDASSPTLTNVTFSGNLAWNNGGGIYNIFGSNPTLTNVTFSGNEAADGGGIQNVLSSPTLTNVTFNDNIASYVGGGMFNSGSSPTLTNVSFSRNWALEAGGMLNEDSSNATLTNVTFSGNTATYRAGGMRNINSSPTLTNVTLSGNSVADYDGGGIENYWYSSPTIRNSVVWGNAAPTGPSIYNYDSTPTIIDSIVEGGCPAGSSCTNVITTDPLLGAVGNYGGGTDTVPLLPGSSAIDAGNDASCYPTDQRGVARFGTHCDIGAFESRGFALTKTNGDNQTTAINMAFANALTLDVASPYDEPVEGGVITFAAPSSGASTSPDSRTSAIASGAASASFSANGTVGAYSVMARTGNTSIAFGLANLKGNTSPTITSSANPSLVHSTVTFTVTVTSPSGGTPSGTVEFYETISPSQQSRAPRRSASSQPLVGGQATFTASSLTVGSHNLLAMYSGDANYRASNSALYSQVVDPQLLYWYVPWVSKNP